MGRKRKSGEGTIRLRTDGRWEGRVVVGYDDRGYPKTRNVTAKTKAECVEKLKKLRDSLSSPKPKEATPEMPFGEWVDLWYQTWSKPKLRPTTQQNYEGVIYNHIIPELGQIPLNKLTQSDLQQFYTQLKTSGRMRNVAVYGEGLSNRTIRACHAACRMALDRAVTEGLIKANPAIGCKLPPKKDREMQVLTHEEMQRFLIQAKEEGFYELFLLELSTGLRRGELLALQWGDLNFATGELRVERQIYRVKGQLTINQPKTKASIRTLIVPASVLNVLKAYQPTTHSRWMFPSPVKDDLPRDPASVRKRLHTILDHAGCKQVRFHDLRHTFATTALEHGMDVKTLSAIIGHVSSGTTLDIYAHVTDEMQRKAAEHIDQGIAKAEPQPIAESAPKQRTMTTFRPVKGKTRRPGTGCITRKSDHLWEGRYSPIWPDGKKHARNVYAHSEEECERLLADLIQQMKGEIAALKARGFVEIPAPNKPRDRIEAYLRAHPDVTNKSAIAREVQVDRETVRKYYDEIQAGMERENA